MESAPSSPAPRLPTVFDVTVIVPTFNGERYLERLITMVQQQSYRGSVEILVIDSGSTDGTLAIVRAHSSVRLHEIPNSEFGHGRTRNLAARLASGRVLVFLTQDAIPLTTRWLESLTDPLNPDGLDAVAVLGRQHPRPDCFPLQKYEITTVFARFGVGTAPVIYQLSAPEPTPAQMSVLAFYSDVNCATRREFLLDVIPYQDLRYSEDMAFGRDVIEAGFRKAYAPDGVVEHSNDLSLREYGKRIFDETLAIRRLDSSAKPPALDRVILRMGHGIVRDSLKIVGDRDYSVRMKGYWLLVNPMFHLGRWINHHRAMHVDLDDHRTIEANSLEFEKTRSPKDTL